MVGDVHRTLLYGGLFAYPADAKNKDTLLSWATVALFHSAKLCSISIHKVYYIHHSMYAIAYHSYLKIFNLSRALCFCCLCFSSSWTSLAFTARQLSLQRFQFQLGDADMFCLICVSNVLTDYEDISYQN